MQREFRWQNVVAIVLAILLFAGLFVWGYSIIQKDKDAPQMEDGGAFTVDGVSYNPSNYRTNILFIGVEKESVTAADGTQSTVSVADYLCLLSFDIRSLKYYTMPIHRDTLTDVRIYGEGEVYLGKTEMPIRLAYSYGTNAESRAMNCVKAVSDLFEGVSIDYYVSLQLEDVAALNDLLGGVSVELLDDFTLYDASMEKGATLKLQGDQAEYYLRETFDDDASNLSRMRRQCAYVDALIQSVNGASFDVSEAYRKLKDSINTNCSLSVVDMFVSNFKSYGKAGTFELPGTEETADGASTFTVDRDALLRMLTQTLFSPVK